MKRLDEESFQISICDTPIDTLEATNQTVNKVGMNVLTHTTLRRVSRMKWYPLPLEDNRNDFFLRKKEKMLSPPFGYPEEIGRRVIDSLRWTVYRNRSRWVRFTSSNYGR